MDTTSTRRLGPLLLLGLLSLPALFCWILLLRGYESSLRRTVFGYAGIMTAIGFAGQMSR